jgi:hypothetical protein
MDAIVARKCWRTLEPYHGFVYFAPEPTAAYDRAGLDRPAHYFASRAAAMGAVTAEVVIATFYNFHPSLVTPALPAVWEQAPPEAVLLARLDGIDGALRRVLGDAVDGREMKEAVELARRAAEAAAPAAGRPLFAAHAGLPWPDSPHLQLWHATTLLREFRGDGHIAALVTSEIGPCEALITHAASGAVTRAALQSSRAWPDDEWAAAEDNLRSRGWLDGDGALTEAGEAGRQAVEDRTDELALTPWLALGEEDCARLRTLVRPFSVAITESGTFGSFGANRRG